MLHEEVVYGSEQELPNGLSTEKVVTIS